VFGEYSVRARPGHSLAPCLLSSGARTFDVLGTGFTLLAFGVDKDLPSRWSNAAATLGLPLTIESDSWEDERREYGSRLVLVRPDRFVAWVGHGESADPVDVLTRATGAVRESEMLTVETAA
jgi:4-hydroxyisophthalate hydroxylase